ncbi:PilZ domain-containing protein [Marinobacterium sp. AK62]|uniref:PilZ domain-containing protein n=1 Tax=Marinobacterium alkalitolerans TaxID=1542925 RepID=A0ABS3ZB32_9GAMM|nr:PilZ domain-containing protein [Marinobacterium alkalitolerans]MBP0048826.1 PilZ domain-containing protein [Marinobacterium alkalitolerans]
MKPNIQIPELKDSGRRAYRLHVDEDDPIEVHIGDIEVNIRDLSETGLAFITDQALTDTRVPAHIKFRIDSRTIMLECQLILVRKVGQVWCADIDGLSAREHKLLSEFITWCQTRAIRRAKKKV